MKKIFLILSVLILVSCKKNNETKQVKVIYYGAMHDIMQGKIDATFNLEKLKSIKHLYALGALENLKGEIQIFDSKPHISRKNGNSLGFDYSFNNQATLLVYAVVKKWIRISIPSTIETQKQLEVFIEQQAISNGIDINQPFPFLLKGKPVTFDWHVINWKKADTIHTHKKHKTAGIYGSLNEREVEILGFYSKKHQGIFTHHNSFTHMHVKTKGKGVAGHVDDLIIGENMFLFLPKK